MPGPSTSNSSVISPTISSSRSSSVTIPAVPPCSSITIAMWNFSVRISRQQLGDALLLRHEHGVAHRDAHRSAPGTGARLLHEVLQVDEPDDVVGGVLVAGHPRVPGLDGPADRVLDRGLGLDGHHVGARHHHLAHDGVAELEDRVDELALLALDGLLVGRDVGHRAEVLLGDERTLLQALAREHHVGEADEARATAAAAAGSSRSPRGTASGTARRGRGAGSSTSSARPRRSRSTRRSAARGR